LPVPSDLLQTTQPAGRLLQPIPGEGDLEEEMIQVSHHDSARAALLDHGQGFQAFLLRQAQLCSLGIGKSQPGHHTDREQGITLSWLLPPSVRTSNIHKDFSRRRQRANGKTGR
jgi:hypothetical protein